MLSKGAELPRPPPTHPEETEEELTETNDMQEDDGGASLHRCGISDNQSVAMNESIYIYVIVITWMFLYLPCYSDQSGFRRRGRTTAHPRLRDLVCTWRARRSMGRCTWKGRVPRASWMKRKRKKTSSSWGRATKRKGRGTHRFVCEHNISAAQHIHLYEMLIVE